MNCLHNWYHIDSLKMSTNYVHFLNDIRVDKTSGFWVGYPKKTEIQSSGRVRLLSSGYFGSENPKKLENSGRVGFKKFGFFGH